MVFGHRGSAYGPENTLTAISEGLAAGAHGIEIDVQLSSDGVIVVYHDEHIAQVGPVAKTSWQRLQQIDLGQGETIPTLDRVLDQIAARAVLNIEIKSERTADSVIDCVSRHLETGAWQPERLLISSFRHEELRQVHSLAPELPLGVLSETGESGHLDLAVRLNAIAAHIDYRAITPDLVADVSKRGLKLYAYTVNRAADLQRLAVLGVDGVISDDPALACATTT